MAKKRTTKPRVPAKSSEVSFVKLPNAVMVGSSAMAVEEIEIPQAEGALGFFETSHSGHRIVIDKRLKEWRKLAVFIHEVLHAVSDINGLGLQHKQIDGIAEGLTQALGPWIAASQGRLK